MDETISHSEAVEPQGDGVFNNSIPLCAVCNFDVSRNALRMSTCFFLFNFFWMARISVAASDNEWKTTSLP